ncbi:hypothetical protein PYCCODRAFT_919508 [Trametes coccinea BRFM310]|uniref:DUF6593 domain-containing protein n=1 Tax=Trametes coccinea (strain BRFM310) TaxID=1353009 RepID=A0A1Y2IZ10_TRAC3|nr:hypothetical protein PYCCODRAFT_919508 [Trametes coccinea BRFM310]
MSAPIAATLTLSPDNPCNTVILNDDGKPLYTVHTEHTKSASVTYVRNAADEHVLASLEWRDVLPDRVTLGDKGPMSVRDWLHTSLVPFHLKDDVSFRDDAGRKYKWRGNAPGRSLELYAADDGYAAPIARFRKSRRDRTTGTHAPAALLLTARALDARDAVVLSFLFLERRRRTDEAEVQSRADVLGTPALAAAAGADYVVRNGGV